MPVIIYPVLHFALKLLCFSLIHLHARATFPSRSACLPTTIHSATATYFHHHSNPAEIHFTYCTPSRLEKPLLTRLIPTSKPPPIHLKPSLDERHT
ncbi:hypothetical protein M758_UG090500 [Ceratodon purpureus]|nr:hypothetical protein M758_UG090500 [Ceratodon purpureus]